MEDRYDDGQEQEQIVYTDPNADVVPEPEEDSSQDNYEETNQSGQNSSQEDNAQQNYSQQSYNQQNYGQQNYGYQDNYDYNTESTPNYTQNYEEGMDASPLSMGDWLLIILVSMIPCAGLILYIVWAFGKTGNINRRNFCRANLIIMVFEFVISLILIVVFGASFVALGGI